MLGDEANPEVPAQGASTGDSGSSADEYCGVQRYSARECGGGSKSSSSQVPIAVRGKRRFQKRLNLGSFQQCSAESRHVMTSTSEKLTFEEVNEMAQWQDVDMIPKSTSP